ncbi:MAG TPA: hypothetical protein VNX25_05520 [Verrucomicrobiae bacterium]|nr:hypothetical protein [Verrucomicrobiae bacterium]
MIHETCRCGHRLVANLCFGCDMSSDECTCDDFIVLRSFKPLHMRTEMRL